MENHRLVLPEHLNQYGFLMGGNLLKWVDEFAWIGASLECPNCNFVTIAFDKVVFKKSIREGTILKFSVEKVSQGTTSVTYSVKVSDSAKSTDEKDLLYSTNVTFVHLDKHGNKSPLPMAVP